MCFAFVLNDGRRSHSLRGGFFKKTHPNPLLLGEGLQDFQSLGEGIYLLLIGGGGEAGGGFRRESRWGLRELGNELEGAWEWPKDEGV